MRTARADIRPALVALYYGDDSTGMQAVLNYGLKYLRIHSARGGSHISPKQRYGAVAHGLLRLCRPKEAGTTDKRAKELGIRAQTFRALSNFMLEIYKRRLAEGAVNFIEAAAESEDPGMAGTVTNPMSASQWWRPSISKEVLTLERESAEAYVAGRPAHGHLIKLRTWIDCRPPIRRPPVLAPEKDQYPQIEAVSPMGWRDVLGNSEEFQFDEPAAA